MERCPGRKNDNLSVGSLIDILFARTEFNLFNWRTSGEEVSDEEWAVVVANFPLEQGELTLDGFLTLHHMEAEDNGGDEAELRVTLQTMGWVAFLWTCHQSEI